MRLTIALFVFVAVALLGLARTAEGDSFTFTGPAVGVPGYTQGANVNYVNADATKMLLVGDGTQLERSDFDSGTGQWLPRVPLGFPVGDTTPSVAPDGSLYYVHGAQIYRSPGQAWSWSPGSAVAIPNLPANPLSPFFNGHDLFFTSGNNDIYASHWDAGTGQFQAAVPLDSINSAQQDATPWVSADGMLMIFASDRDGGYGSKDLYSATWNPGTAQWGQVTNLGPNVNTSAEESLPSYAYDADTLYFTRFPAQGGLGWAMQADVGLAPQGGAVPLPGVAWSVLGLLGCLMVSGRHRRA